MDDAISLTIATEGALGDSGFVAVEEPECLQSADLCEEPVLPVEGDDAACDGVAAPDAQCADADVSGQPDPLRIVEALLFSTDAPLSAARLAEAAGVETPTRVRKLIEELNASYETAGQAFRVEHIARGFQMMTRVEFRPWLDKLNKQRSDSRLSEAALEALSIVAYRQPIIRADVEAIRGVACGEVLHRLREVGLIRIEGRADVVGRPMLYGTTKKFLNLFGLADLDDLPPMEALELKSCSKARDEVEPLQPPTDGDCEIPDPPAIRAAAGA